MRDRPSLEEITEALRLEPHPTCGLTSVTHVAPGTIAADALPAKYEEAHPYASGMYFLVTQETKIGLHALRSDQIYHYHCGDPLEVLLVDPDGSWAVQTVGVDLKAGERPQLLIRGGTYHVSRVKEGGEYSLLSTVEFPGFTPEDLESVEPKVLADQFPDAAEAILDFTND